MSYMTYTTNPHIKKVRYKAYWLVHYQSWSVRKTARHFGYAHNTVLRWVKEKPYYNSKGELAIPARYLVLLGLAKKLAIQIKKPTC